MMEDILKNLIQSNGENLLVNATEAVIKKSKDKTAWKKLFVNTGEFFINRSKMRQSTYMKICQKYFLRQTWISWQKICVPNPAIS